MLTIRMILGSVWEKFMKMRIKNYDKAIHSVKECWCFFVLFLFLLTGCAKIPTETNQTGEQVEGQEKGSADAYQLTMGSSFQEEVLRGDVSSKIVFCPGMAVKCSIYSQADDGKKNAKVSVIAADGERMSYEWNGEEARQIIGAGVSMKADGFLTICLEKAVCYCEKRNATGEIRERILLDGLEADANSFFMTMADEEGYMHVEDSLASRGGNGKWYIFSPDGKCFHQEQYDSGSFQGLVALPDGRVGYCHGEASENLANVIDSMDVRTGEKKSISYDVKNIASDHKSYAIASMGNREYVFVDELGIHQGDDTHENDRTLFSWKRNGMRLYPPMLINYGICVDKEGRIYVLADTDEGTSFMELMPVSENIREIELASGRNLPDYCKAVQEFNKKHRECRIVIRDDYEKTALLTKLLSGDGPVIVDVHAIPYWEKEEMWEPLEKMVSNQTIDELNRDALRIGYINGISYAAVCNFNINTLVSLEELGKWDYDSVLECAQSRKGIKSILRNDGMNKTAFLTSLFVEGDADTYFLNEEKSEDVILEERLANAIQLTEKYADSGTDEGIFEGIRKGTVLCGKEILAEPSDLSRLKEVYGEQARCVGYPHKDGGKHHLVSAGVLAVRRNATDEEKRIAAEFLEMLFSYEVQSDTASRIVNCSFSVRQDVLDEQIEKAAEKEGLVFSYCGEQHTFGKIDTKELKRQMDEILNNSVPAPNRSSDFQVILSEELDGYFGGGNSFEMLVDHLEHRLKLYYEE